MLQIVTEVAVSQRPTRSMVALSLMGDDEEGMCGDLSFDKFCKKEELMWSVLKSTYFWQTLRTYLEKATPLPAPCFLRMQMQMPHDMTPEELGRLFHEQDTVTLVSVVRFQLFLVLSDQVCFLQASS